MSARILAPLALAVLALPLPAHAATLQVQGLLRNTSGGPATDGPYVFFLKLYDAKDAKTAVWQDAVPGVQVQGGLFQLALGATEAAPLKDDLLTAGKALWLGVQVASDPELERVPLGAVARAWYAHNAGGLDCSGCVQGPALADNAVTSQKVAFAYAGSETKGGPATTAKMAEVAQSAKTAESAATAKVAEAAVKAGTADEATSLACTGCVTLKHLHADVAGGFLSVKGGNVAGDVALKGKLTVDGAVEFAGSTLGGGQWADTDTSKAACDAKIAGRIAFAGASGRLALCDGKSWRKLAFCSDTCLPGGLVACGKPITDGCGDAGTCSGTGTQCPGVQTCSGGVCKLVAASCKALLDAVPGSKSGLYDLDPDGAGPGQPFPAYCDMGSDGGGWTLLMKQDGNKDTLTYDAPLWTNTATLQPDKPDFDGNEFKSPGAMTMAFKQVRLVLKTGSEVKGLTLPIAANSLVELWKGPYVQTSAGKDAWKTLMPGPSTQPNCNREGANADCAGRRVRLGLLTNQENDCNSCDSYLGLGHTGQGGCDGQGQSWCGMMASCSADNGAKNVPALGYLFVR
jgi:hypothetical protein